MKESYVEIVEELGVSCSGILKDGNTEYLVFLFLIFICLLGCIRSQLQHAGSFLHHIGYFLVVHGLSCVTQAQ